MKPPKIDDPHFMRQLARLVASAKAEIGAPIIVGWTYDPEAKDPEQQWRVEVNLHPGKPLGGPYVTDSGIGAIVLAADDFERRR